MTAFQIFALLLPPMALTMQLDVERESLVERARRIRDEVLWPRVPGRVPDEN